MNPALAHIDLPTLLERGEKYRSLRFDAGAIPKGLRQEHNLKDGVYGHLRVNEGSLVFVDHEQVRRHLDSGESLIIFPTLVHHLEDCEDAAIQIDFYRMPSP